MRKLFAIVAASFLSIPAVAQDLLKGMEDSVASREKVAYAFKSTRVINAHSIEMLSKGNLDFRILHRFGRVNSGVGQWFGLDAASMRMSFDYGLTNDLMVGIGRSTFRKEIDGFIKARFCSKQPAALIIYPSHWCWRPALPSGRVPHPPL